MKRLSIFQTFEADYGFLGRIWYDVCRRGKVRELRNSDLGQDAALANSLDGGAEPIYFIDFLKQPMKLKNFRFIGVGDAPLDPSL